MNFTTSIYKSRFETIHEVSIFQINGDLDGGKLPEFETREQVLGLVVAEDEFYIPLSSIQEIIMLPALTFVPHADPYIDGVANLRGTIIPAINTRKLMGFGRGTRSSTTRLVIAKEDETVFGLIVDGITSVVGIRPSDIEAQPTGGGPAFDLIPRISKQDSRIRGIIDTARILRYVGGEALK